MGNIISKIYDDYEDYETLCKFIGAPTIPIRPMCGEKSFYDHAKEILQDEKYFAEVEKLREQDYYLYRKFI